MNTIPERIAKQVAWVQKRPGFNRAQNILEVGAGAFTTLAELAQRYPDKQFSGVDHELRPPALALAEQAPGNLQILRHDVRNLSLFSAEQFDFVYSAAVLEHIKELPEHLAEVYRILRPGGRYCFSTAPLWSSSQGHHCDHNAADCPIPHYAHLFKTRAQLGDFLIAERGKSPDQSAQILRRVYDRKDLSRLSRTQVRQIIENSAFEIESWKEGGDKNCTKALIRAVEENNVYGLDLADLKISSIVGSLLKISDKDKQPSIWQTWLGRLLPSRKND
ncbi:MAG: class I SAM-dependent methyltransferase [Rhodocyclaceae bacterium]|nr:class I SAM-dependent methyltransferase [Rhodocyclaceae bacterium]